MSFKTTYWLFGILIVIVGVVGLALYFDPMPPDLDPFILPDENNPKAPFATDKVYRVALERKESVDKSPTEKLPAERLTVERDPKLDLWRMTEPVSTEADRSQISSLINQVIHARRDLKAEAGNASKLGLDPAKTQLTFGILPDRQLSLDIGNATFGTSDAVIYVRSPERKQICVVRKNDLDLLLKPASAFRSRDLLTAAPSDVLALKLSHTADGKAKEPAVSLVKKQDLWAFQAPFSGTADNLATDTKVDAGQAPTNMAALLNLITRLQAEYKDEKDNDFVASNVTDWKQYGLQDGGDLVTVEIKRAEKYHKEYTKADGEDASPSTTQTLVIAVGKKVDDKTDKYYARRLGENNVFRVPAGPVSSLLKLLEKPDSVRDRHLLTLDSERRVPNVIRIKNESGELEFFKRDKDKPWQLYRGTATTPLNVDENVVKGMLGLLGQDKMIEGFPAPGTPDVELGLNKPDVVASFWIDGIAPEEKKDEKKDKDDKKDGKDKADKDKDDKKGDQKKPADEKKPDPNAKPKLKDPEKPTAKLTFGKRNAAKKTVFVKRELPGEEPAVFEVRDVLVERLSEGPLSYLDPKLASFREGLSLPTQNVTKVVLTHKGKVTEITREKDGSPWKIVQPKEFAGRGVDDFAITSMLGTLNRLRANKFLAEKVPPAKLASEYGLEPPASKAEISITENGKTLVYEIAFGKEATEPTSIFARLGGAFNSDLVFTLDRSILNVFDREILDAIVFKFTPAKVKEILLRGWNTQAGFVVTLELVRKDEKTWAVKTAPGPEEFPLDSTKVEGFLALLSNLRADSFASHGKQPEGSQELDVKLGGLSIKLTVEGEEKPLTLLIGKAEGQSYLAISSTLPGDILHVNKSIFDGPKGSVAYFKK
jgi:hypothetical protein